MKSGSKISHGMLLAVLAGSFVLTNPASVFAEAKDFSGHWASSQITKWMDKGYIAGYEDGSFKPDHSITRAEFITLVNKSFGFTEKTSVDYKDVSPGQWFYDEFAIAKAAGYISGYEDGTVRPNNKITRQEAAVIVGKLLKINGATAENNAQNFIDSSAMASWSKGSIAVITGKGIMHGYPDKMFKPGNAISRAESVVTLDQALSMINASPQPAGTQYDKAGTYGPAAGTETIEGNVVFAASDVTLQNTIITGDLTLAESVGEGTAHLQNVTVKGTTTIKGGGANSVYAADSTFSKVVVNKKGGGVHIVASGATNMDSVTLQSGGKLEQGKLTGTAKGFSNVTIEASDQAAITLSGSFNSVSIHGNASIELSGGTIDNLEVEKGANHPLITLLSDITVKNFTANDAVKVNGTGKIENAKANANGVSFAQKPVNLQTAQGIQVSIGSTGGGGGGGGSSSSSGSGGSSGSVLTGNSITIGSDYNGRTLDSLQVSQDVTITANNFTLKNVHIPGNLKMTAANKINLENVTVDGVTTLQ
ncbi:S-layer homology domain-containing protein [Aneurinibacillus terranovensis]|uniref:S-layer homology domain-containing protein n=1 Tax=Aneurinibacillus terranovensis TaxID=278991 RepID=UPI00041FAC51|nr:S-layer homology domain-containing protein [Aneurinibacillus terranovensis]